MICTSGEFHLLREIPSGLFRHQPTAAEPRLLGYECHCVLAGQVGSYDFYCFAEDDILIDDPLFFWKLSWFSGGTGPDMLLQPNRFELSLEPPIHKLYLDGPLVDPSIVPRLQIAAAGAPVVGKVLGQEVVFERTANPHSGCFFLSADQMRRWREQPYFLDRSEAFWGPLESAATLGIMRTFAVYKPAAANAGFLEVRHLDEQYLGKRVVYHSKPQSRQAEAAASHRSERDA